MDVTEEKKALRQYMRQVRGAISPEAKKLAEDDIAERLFNLPAVKKARTIAIYQATGSEASVTDLARAIRLTDPTVAIAYPAISGAGIMFFARVDAGEKPVFLSDPLALVDPHSVGDHFIEPDQIDLMLVPGIAFDEAKHRLGQGGGFYDRYLERLRRDCMTIGIAFEEQIVEQVPCGLHDRKVDYIVTPKRIIS